MEKFIELGWHTVPLKGKLHRNDDGTKTVPDFPSDWRNRYTNTRNTEVSRIGGTITGECSGIIAIDCDNTATWELFHNLDPDYEFVFRSRGVQSPKGTIIYRYDQDLAESFSLNDGSIALDFYSNKGFIYLATDSNRTKVPLNSPLPALKEVPAATKLLLLQLAKPTTQPKKQITNVYTANCLAPQIKQFTDKVGSTSASQYFPFGLFKIITPKDFRELPEYVEQGYLHPKSIPPGRGSEYLSKISAILGKDISIDHDLYVAAIHAINDMFTEPMQKTRLEKTIMDPMLTGKASINGTPIWQYSADWDQYRLILASKRQAAIEVCFDDRRNMYYVVDETNQHYKQFGRDSELMSYLEASAINVPKKMEVKSKLPIVNVSAEPSLPFGFNEGTDVTARLMNTFIQTPELAIFNDPESYRSTYTRPVTTLKYLDTLVPEHAMRNYLLSFIHTKLTTFGYSPVILYFMGTHGSGKDLFVSLLETILGSITRPTTREFLELFNGWLVDSYFVQLDEYGNQLTTYKEREEALGKIKAYTGKSNVQIRAMRTDGFMYHHKATFILTSNKNPLMVEENDRRVCFLATPNVLAEQPWVLEEGGIAEVYKKIQAEIKDFCYYLATEVKALPTADYVVAPQSEQKNTLIANSMSAGPKLAYAIKHNMKDYLANLADEYQITLPLNGNYITTAELLPLYEELTNDQGEERDLIKSLKNNGVTVIRTTKDGKNTNKIEFIDAFGELD